MSNRKFFSSRGAYTLELTFAALVTISLIAGGSDLTKILLAQSALDAAIEEAMRPCYTTDGGCFEPGNPPTTTWNQVWLKPILGYIRITQE